MALRAPLAVASFLVSAATLTPATSTSAVTFPLTFDGVVCLDYAPAPCPDSTYVAPVEVVLEQGGFGYMTVVNYGSVYSLYWDYDKNRATELEVAINFYTYPTLALSRLANRRTCLKGEWYGPGYTFPMGMCLR